MSMFLFLLAAASPPAAGTVPKRQVVLEFATCVRRRAPDRAADLLRSVPGSDDERKKVLVIGGAYGACLKDRWALSFQTGMLRGQLAELAFRDDAGLRQRAAALPALAPVRPDAAAIDAAVTRVPAAERDAAYAGRFRAAFAQCVADANPGAVAMMLNTDPGTVEERAALLRSGDTLMRCMPQGVTYHIIPAELRPYLVADLHYRVATATQAGS